jgi:hypothetical protein
VVVTLQENNHIVVVDLEKLAVINDFPAGAVTLNGIDTEEDGVISLTDTLANVLREPDAVTWLPGPQRDRALPPPTRAICLAARRLERRIG